MTGGREIKGSQGSQIQGSGTRAIGTQAGGTRAIGTRASEIRASEAQAGNSGDRGTQGGRAAGPASPGELSALQAALAAEHAAVYGYGVAGAHLSGSQRAAATADWVAHQIARDHLEAMLRSRGAQPAAAAVAYQLPEPVRSRRAAATLALYLEDQVAPAYLGLVAMAAPDVRSFGARQLRGCALRAAYWRGSTVAFPGLRAGELARVPSATPAPTGPAG